MFLNNRYYDPQAGVFLSVDPLVASTGEPYLYASGNPTTMSDPTGLCTMMQGELWCTSYTGGWANYSDPNWFVERAWLEAELLGPMDITFEASFMPGIGDVMDVASCGGSVYGGDWGGASFDCGAMAIPFLPSAADEMVQAGKRVLDDVAPKIDEAADAAQSTKRWLRGTSGNAGRVPDSVADALSGKTYTSWSTFKSDFWKAVANDPDLADGFTDLSVAEMLKGNAPFVDPSQAFGGNNRYVLHHVTPRARGGGEFDLSNIVVVTPRYHREVLNGSYHYGGRY